jgi:hypothetical protein
MKLSQIRTGLVATAAISFLFTTGPAVTQEGDDLPQLTKPTKDQESTPGLQQTPDGQTMKTAGEMTRPTRECFTGGSTGPTLPRTEIK